MNLESLLTHRAGFGLVTASPVQRAVCRIAEGVPLGDLAIDQTVIDALGGLDAVRAYVAHPHAPRELYLLAGIRSGKSLIAAAIALRAAVTCDCTGLLPGEIPRVSVLSLKLDLAGVVFGHLLGAVQTSAALKALLVGEPTSDTIVVRNVSGRNVEVRVVAGAKAGASVIARWSAGLVADEFPRMLGQDDGVVTFDDARTAVLGRLLPGAQLTAIGSPWAPFGPGYQVVQDFWGKPTGNTIVLRAPAPALNPQYWTAERVDEVRRNDERAYRTDVLGEFCDPETSMFPSEVLAACTRAEPVELPTETHRRYTAAIDPATRGNAWTLVVLTRDRLSEGGKRRVVLARQWQGSIASPLSPEATIASIAEIVRPYRVTQLATDQWSIDALRDSASRCQLGLCQYTVAGADRVHIYDAVRAALVDRVLELAPVPALLADLGRVSRRVTAQGMSIVLPKTADGRHCDYAAALAIALQQPIACADEPVGAAVSAANKVLQDARKIWTPEERRDLQAFEAQIQRQKQRAGGGYPQRFGRMR